MVLDVIVGGEIIGKVEMKSISGRWKATTNTGMSIVDSGGEEVFTIIAHFQEALKKRMFPAEAGI